MNNTDNWFSLMRSVFKIVGTVIVTLGFATAGQVDTIVTAATSVIGSSITLIGLFMSMWTHTPDEAPKAVTPATPPVA
jgi:hypothetical protein